MTEESEKLDLQAWSVKGIPPEEEQQDQEE